MLANNTNNTARLDVGYTGFSGSKSGSMQSFSPISRSNYVIASYQRISEQDDVKDESNSIKNQRAMIENYIALQSEFANATVIDYVDDGISGSHTERKAYQRLMADVKRGAVQCIAVKDLSRIGRDSIEVDDLLMNFLEPIQQ